MFTWKSLVLWAVLVTATLSIARPAQTLPEQGRKSQHFSPVSVEKSVLSFIQTKTSNVGETKEMWLNYLPAKYVFISVWMNSLVSFPINHRLVLRLFFDMELGTCSSLLQS